MWSLLKKAFDGFLRHKSARLGAALAYYSVFSIGPLLLIVTAVAGFFFGAETVRNSLTSQFRDMLGDKGTQAIEVLLKGAESTTGAGLSAVFGVVLLIVAALGVVVQLRDALNTIFETNPPEDAGIGWYTRVYALAFAGILALGFLLATALVISAGLTAFASWFSGSATQSLLLSVVNFVASLAVLTVLFMMLFKWLPDRQWQWREVAIGGFATALLFNIGKSAIAWYIGSQGLESTYGAASSIVVLLIWVYYSSQIVLFGAELTQANASAAPAPARHPAR